MASKTSRALDVKAAERLRKAMLARIVLIFKRVPGAARVVGDDRVGRHLVHAGMARFVAPGRIKLVANQQTDLEEHVARVGGKLGSVARG